LDINKPLSQAYYLKKQLREIWMQPNKQEAKGHVRWGETGAGEQSAAADENGCHDHGVQNRYSGVERLPHIDRESGGDQQ